MTTNPNDVIRATAGYSYNVGGQLMSNVLHFADTGGGGITDADLLTEMGLMLELIFNAVHTLQSVGLQYTEYSVQNVTQGVIIGTLPWPTFTSGLGAGALDISQCVALLRMPTPASQVQGRVNLPGLTEDQILGSVIDAAFIAAALTVGGQLLLPFTVIGGQLTYIVYNQVLFTFNIPNSTAIGSSTRILGRRRKP